MAGAANYDDVLAQLRSVGLQIDDLIVGRMVRSRVEGDREKRGWYVVHELQTLRGDMLLVGSYGVWQGADNGARKIELRKTELSAEQREALRRRLTEDRKRVDRERAAEAERAAQRAASAWAKCEPTGESDYLLRKGVGAHGVRYSPSGALVIPMLDAAGKIHGLQVIRGKNAKKRGLQKEFWPVGLAKKGHFHLIGAPVWIVLVVEGYATGATLHEATGLPVAIAFDANNLPPVAAALRKRYKRVQILICADDDVYSTHAEKLGGCGAKLVLDEHPTICPDCGNEHKRSNTGVVCASAAALQVGGQWLRPAFANQDARTLKFERQGIKLTDFNDLHQLEGLHVVRTQVEARLSELGWSPGGRATRNHGQSGGGGGDLHPVETLDELLERYALVYGHGGTVFDYAEHCMLQLSDMRDACISRELHRAWAEHPDRQIVRIREVGFDPTELDRSIRCNLWGGWPTRAKAGSCERLLELLRYMCSAEGRADELYRWILAWVAYPIQFPGAKIKSTIVIHGPQGTGKSRFFEAVQEIYGEYGSIIGQHALEDKHNDWASRRLFLIADEVVARSDLYHVKNTLKSFITGGTIRINPKHIRAYDERNHCNIVFLSNEMMPVVLEEDDRRHAVLWTPEKLPMDFYDAVTAEVNAGGVAALHDYLLHYDVGDFRPDTPPPMTQAKAELVNLSLDSTSRFQRELMAGDIGGVKARPALATDVYDLYKRWTGNVGLRAAPLNKLVNVLGRKHRVDAVRKRYTTYAGTLGPHSILMFGDAEMPPGTSESLWLGEQIEAFRQAVDDYKGVTP